MELVTIGGVDLRKLTLLHSRSTNAALLASSPLKTSRAAATPVETALWTDRYRPKRFVDLLGDEVRPGLALRMCASVLSPKTKTCRCSCAKTIADARLAYRNSASTAPPSSGSKNGTPASSEALRKQLLRRS